MGVEPALIASEGAVSQAVARAMAAGAVARSHAEVSVAVTGIAGPAGGSADKPVGTVWFAWQAPGWQQAELRRFSGDRAEVRRATAQHALAGLLKRLSAPSV